MELASNHHQIVLDRTKRKSAPGILQVDAISTISTQISALSKNVHKCGSSISRKCPDGTSYVF